MKPQCKASHTDATASYEATMLICVSAPMHAGLIFEPTHLELLGRHFKAAELLSDARYLVILSTLRLSLFRLMRASGDGMTSNHMVLPRVGGRCPIRQQPITTQLSHRGLFLASRHCHVRSVSMHEPWRFSPNTGKPDSVSRNEY